jgi:chemotaxis protein methyltransferase CheR
MILGYAPLSDVLFQKFSTLVFENTGIFLKPEKKELLNARLGKRLRECRIDSFDAYYDYVQADTSGEELTNLINSVSTNFTSFFRENAHFEYLADEVLPEFSKSGSSELKVWSAACSSGEEPYTLSIVLHDYKRRNGSFSFSIQATDISTRVLDIARAGVYTDERIRAMPRDILEQYFQKGKGNSAGYVKVKRQLRDSISFKYFNLMGDFPWVEEFDIIFCRNVMIYFNRETQQELVNKFSQCLKPGGYLFIGHSESLTSIEHSFKQVSTTAYKK